MVCNYHLHACGILNHTFELSCIFLQVDTHQLLSGTSSFGMSGVNAHMVFSPSTCPEPVPHVETPTHGKPVWERARHWFSSARHAMLHTVITRGSGQRALCEFAIISAPSASLDFMDDHKVGRWPN